MHPGQARPGPLAAIEKTPYGLESSNSKKPLKLLSLLLLFVLSRESVSPEFRPLRPRKETP